MVSPINRGRSFLNIKAQWKKLRKIKLVLVGAILLIFSTNSWAQSSNLSAIEERTSAENEASNLKNCSYILQQLDIGAHANIKIHVLVSNLKSSNPEKVACSVEALDILVDRDDEQTVSDLISNDAVSTLAEVLESEPPIETSIKIVPIIGYKFPLEVESYANFLSSEELVSACEQLKKSLEVLENLNEGNIWEIDTNLIGKLHTESCVCKKNDVFCLVRNRVKKHPVLGGGIAYLSSMLMISLGLLWVRPLWLLRINNLLALVDFQLPGWLGNIRIPPRHGLIFGFFHYHPRVLDAWIKAHIASAKTEFNKRRTVKERSLYVPIPVTLNGKNVSDLTAERLQLEFSDKVLCLLIWGEGGIGKTSLACQLAQWAMESNSQKRLCSHVMLPVFLEQEIDLQTSQGDTQFLLASIHGQLRQLVNAQNLLSSELVEHLLRKQRLLVIIDGLSEMGDATRAIIHPHLPDFPINALIVTSRLEEILGNVTRNTLKPLRIEKERLSSFMEAYLTQKGKRELFTDQEFFHSCEQLRKLAGDRNMTAMLARLYADQMVASKASSALGYIPDNVPDLILHYLNQINRAATDNALDDRTVHKSAKIIAWECFRETLSPASAERDTVLRALGKDAETNLDYLENRLQLIQTVGPAQDKICFLLDPIAEYLAGLYLVELNGDNAQRWHKLLAKVEIVSSQSTCDSAKDFARTLLDCCLRAQSKQAVPTFVPPALKKYVENE